MVLRVGLLQTSFIVRVGKATTRTVFREEYDTDRVSRRNKIVQHLTLMVEL